MQEVSDGGSNHINVEERLNVHKQLSDLPTDSKQRAYSEADEIVVVGGPSNHIYQADASKSVERCKYIYLIDVSLDFNQSHISYQGDGEFSSR